MSPFIEMKMLLMIFNSPNVNIMMHISKLNRYCKIIFAICLKQLNINKPFINF